MITDFVSIIKTYLKLSKDNYAKIASLFDIDMSLVAQISKGKIWKNISCLPV